MKTRKFFSLFLGIIMLFQNIVVAAEVTTPSGIGETPVVLQAEATTFSVTVPINLPIELLADGTVITSENAQIINNSPAGQVKVVDVEVQPISEWSLLNYNTTDFKNLKVNSKNFGFLINSEEVDEISGKLILNTENWTTIQSNGGILPINYNAKFSAQSLSISDLQIGNVVFTIDWDK